MFLNPHLTPSPATWDTPHLSTTVPLRLPLTPNMKDTSLRMCFSCPAAPQPHLSFQTSKMHLHGRVFNVQLLLHLASHAGHEKYTLGGIFHVRCMSPMPKSNICAWFRGCYANHHERRPSTSLSASSCQNEGWMDSESVLTQAISCSSITVLWIVN